MQAWKSIPRNHYLVAKNMNTLDSDSHKTGYNQWRRSWDPYPIFNLQIWYNKCEYSYELSTTTKICGRCTHTLLYRWRRLHKQTSDSNGLKSRKIFQGDEHLVGKYSLLAYPNFSEEFVIYTEASQMQIGDVVSQSGRPITLYYRKLMPAQMRYMITDCEFLSIVETLK